VIFPVFTKFGSMRAIARRRAGIELDLVALQREHGPLAAAIAGDVLERHAEHVERHADGDVAAAARADAAGHQILGLDDVGRLLDAGRYVRAHEVDRGAGLIADEPEVLQVHPEAVRLVAVEPRQRRQVSHPRAVSGADLAEMHRAVQAAGALHVLHDQFGLAVDVLGQMPSEQPRLGVGRRAGAEVDQHRETLAFVERLLRRGAGDGHAEHP
jgi:hypothetical protein